MQSRTRFILAMASMAHVPPSTPSYERTTITESEQREMLGQVPSTAVQYSLLVSRSTILYVPGGGLTQRQSAREKGRLLATCSTGIGWSVKQTLRPSQSALQGKRLDRPKV